MFHAIVAAVLHLTVPSEFGAHEPDFVAVQASSIIVVERSVSCHDGYNGCPGLADPTSGYIEASSLLGKRLPRLAHFVVVLEPSGKVSAINFRESFPADVQETMRSAIKTLVFYAGERPGKKTSAALFWTISDTPESPRPSQGESAEILLRNPPPIPGDRAEAARRNKSALSKSHAGDIAGAIVLYESAVAADPAYEWSRYNLACAYGETGRIDEAIRQIAYLRLIDTNEAKKALAASWKDADLTEVRKDERFPELAGRR